MPEIPQFPGAVGLTHLRVYDTPAPDGSRGGSPHVHFTCTECYYISAGAGRVQTLSSEGFQEFEVQEGRLVWFSPGVIHRLINESNLEIFVVMGNGGLPEAGDFVLTFPPSILNDNAAYFQVASLSSHGEVFASNEAAAMRRRDLAVEGFQTLLQDFEARGETALREFYERALPLVSPKLSAWETVWRNGPLQAAYDTGNQLAALQRGDVSHLLQGRPCAMAPPGDGRKGGGRKLGMCGTLATYLTEGTTVSQETSKP
jgi:mannose-6-phosphate isomerase-like protein (cupin superfamily)